MKNINTSLVVLLLFLFSTGCKKENTSSACVSNLAVTDNSSQADDDALLTQLLKEVNELRCPASCNAADKWDFTAIATKLN